MTEELIICQVKEGQASNLKKVCDTILLFSGQVEVIIRKRRSSRSSEQNRYFHAIVTILGKEIGYTKNEMKSIVKTKFLMDEKIIEKTGEVVPYVKETHLLTKSEFADFTSEVIQWASEMGIILPLPNEQTEIELNKE